MVENEDDLSSPLEMTNEKLADVCERLHLSLRKKTIRLKNKYYKDQTEKNLHNFVIAAEELYAYIKIVKICGELGKKIMTMQKVDKFTNAKLPKKEDVN
jgi:hypothetical protein